MTIVSIAPAQERTRSSRKVMLWVAARTAKDITTRRLLPASDDIDPDMWPEKAHEVLKVLLIPRLTNDPSAGSPTETLLRLLLPLKDKVHKTFHCGTWEPNNAAVQIIHRIIQSVGATGGVYKGQGRNQHELKTRGY